MNGVKKIVWLGACGMLVVGLRLCGRVETVAGVSDFDGIIRDNNLVAALFYETSPTHSLINKVSKKKPWRGMIYAAVDLNESYAERLIKRYNLQGEALVIFKDGMRVATLNVTDEIDGDAIIAFFTRHNLDEAIKKVRLERSQRAWMRRQRLDLSGSSPVVMFGANVYPDYVYEGAGDYFGPNYYSSYPRPGYVHFGIGFGF